MTPPSRPQLIRDWLATQDGPRNVAQIADATGIDRSRVPVTLADMRRGEQIAATGKPGSMVYALTGKPMRWKPSSPEEAAERRKRIQRESRRGPDGRTLEQYKAARRAQAAVNAARREAERLQRKANRKPRATKVQPTARQPVPVRAIDGTQTAPAKAAPVMTSFEWEARMLGKVERLPAGQVSEASRLRSAYA